MDSLRDIKPIFLSFFFFDFIMKLTVSVVDFHDLMKYVLSTLKNLEIWKGDNPFPLKCHIVKTI